MTDGPHPLRALIAILLLCLCAPYGAGAEPPGTGTPPQNDTKKPLNNSGCTCDQVTVTPTTEPPKPPGVALVPCGSAAAGVQGTPVGAYDGSGANPKELKWGVTVTGPKDDCCTKVRTGLIQNLLTSTFQADYDGGGRIVTGFVDKDGKPLPLPLVDSDAPTAPGSAYPYYDPTSVGSPAKCGVEVPLTFSDLPDAGGLVLQKGGQKIKSFTRVETFRIYLVYECPIGTYNVLRYYDWTFTLKIGFDTTKTPPTVSSFTSCAEETARGGTNPPTPPTTTGDPPNVAGTRPRSKTVTGF